MSGRSASVELFGEAAHLAASDTLSERAAALVEHDILAGIWQPGDRLGIQALSERYKIGATPLREGLSRLVSRGLISATGQKGFRVATLSQADLVDITEVRIVVESEALRRSMRHGDDEWETRVLSALHRLTRSVEREPETMREGLPGFDHLHKAFHRSLLEACGSERLLRLHDDLYFQAYRYRRTMMSRFSEHGTFVTSHKLLADLVLSRDAQKAEAELASHLRQTLRIVYSLDGTTE
ncbi:GntR family transcriptional regulator [Tianweitania sediminis]|jgi:DNA-binding GntR family transcriptional regulator|uniref:FCD domain-containing protein n=1 Tax=Tianweitania sediminis TaxID=1502156 RepID=A0A8J7R125_9HYPH|nr:FCD domain-containing protein [Tianweitania sediminis]MBP0438265.1 FCD domain-containing protein [Tianweitania sediminis]HEV7415355.1 FCD domain-containing protein [Tianweitania sediminis]